MYRPAVVAAVGLVCVSGLVLAAGVTVAAHRAFIARRRDPPPPVRTTLVRAAPIVTVALAAASLLAVATMDLTGGMAPAGGPGRPVLQSDRLGSLLGIIDRRDIAVRAGEGQAEREGAAGAEPRDSRLTFLLIVAGVVAAAIITLTAWRTHSPRPLLLRRPRGGAAAAGGDVGSDDDRRRDAVHGAVVDTIDAMLADPDPNTAIIGAYARLLEGLAARGAARLAHEGPMEHLRRVLTALEVRPESPRRLIALFEVARFSSRALDTSHRERALADLRAVAADLERMRGAAREGGAVVSAARAAASRPGGARP
ncbi:MAG: DUF4129 domain-containing protein [Gemmatimonadota bacterium]